MPKIYHRQLYEIEQIVLLKSDEQHLNANEHFLLQVIQDLATEVIRLNTKLETLEEEKRFIQTFVRT